MPTYEYQCPKCGVFDFFQKMTDPALATCPTCGSAVSRLLSAAPFHLKGSGWYKTDYANKSNGSSDKPSEKQSSGKTVTESQSSKTPDKTSGTSTSETSASATTKSETKSSGGSDGGSSSSGGGSGSSSE